MAKRNLQDVASQLRAVQAQAGQLAAKVERAAQELHSAQSEAEAAQRRVSQLRARPLRRLREIAALADPDERASALRALSRRLGYSRTTIYRKLAQLRAGRDPFTPNWKPRPGSRMSPENQARLRQALQENPQATLAALGRLVEGHPPCKGTLRRFKRAVLS